MVQLQSNSVEVIDLLRGSRKLLFNAPSGLNKDWHSEFLKTSRSPDGQSLLLPNTFLPLDVTDLKETTERESHPFIAVLRLADGRLTRLLAVRAGFDKGPPTGLYVTNCQYEEITKCDANTRNFEAAHQAALQSKDKKEREAAKAYGTYGEKNGVNVSFGDIKSGEGGG